jgi:hypothetical protein
LEIASGFPWDLALEVATVATIGDGSAARAATVGGTPRAPQRTLRFNRFFREDFSATPCRFRLERNDRRETNFFALLKNRAC